MKKPSQPQTRTSKKILCATVHSPQNPRVRFFANAPGKSPPFDDITHRVKRLIIEEIQDDSGECYLLRLDSEGELVWRTLHPSLQETKWYVEFEFGLPEEKWQPYSDAAP